MRQHLQLNQYSASISLCNVVHVHAWWVVSTVCEGIAGIKVVLKHPTVQANI